MAVRLLPRAIEEAEEGRLRRETDATRDRFVDELEECQRQIGRRPRSFPPHPAIGDPDLRVALFKTFPYLVLFRAEPGGAVIVSVCHASRGPAHLAEAADRR